LEEEAAVAAALAARAAASNADPIECEDLGARAETGHDTEAEERLPTMDGAELEDAGPMISIDVQPGDRARFVRELDWYHLTEHVYGQPFPRSAVLSRKARLQLFHMFDGSAHAGEQWELLYRGSTHGLGSEQFHDRCDDAGPTVVLLQTDLDCVFGGYYDGSWSPVGHTNLAKSRSFLFIFETLRGSCSHKLRVDADPAGEPIVSQDPGFGPLFGVYAPQGGTGGTGTGTGTGAGAGQGAAVGGGGGEIDEGHEDEDDGFVRPVGLGAASALHGGARARARGAGEGSSGGGGGARAGRRPRDAGPAGALGGPRTIWNAICAIHRVDPRIGFATLGTRGCPYESPPGWVDCRYITGTASGQFNLKDIEVYGVRGACARKARTDEH